MRVTCRVLIAACMAVLMIACQKEDRHEAAPAATPAPAPPATRQDWSLNTAAPNAQDALTVDKTAIAAAHTDWPLVVAQLTEFRRKDGALTARLMLRNEGVESQRPLFIFADVHMVDSAGKRYGVLKERNGYAVSSNPYYQDRFFAELDPGGNVTVTMTFAAPPAAVTSASLEIPNIRPLEHLPIQEQ